MSGFDAEEDGLPDWDVDSVRSPAPIQPVSAVAARDLRGRRVIVGLPGRGWRGDLRADQTVVQASRTYVPVIPEQEWYRAESEPTEVFAPLIPIERVWVETVVVAGETEPATPRDLVSRLVSLDAPPRRDPVPARDTVGLTGRRMVRTPGPDEKAAADQRDLRAVTEPYTGTDGDICVRVCAELEWYRWAWSGEPPHTLEIPVHLLWVE